jgi:hypothetical protein
LKKKLKTCQFGSAKWFWPNIFLAEDAETGKKAQQSLTPALLDWLDGLIGPSGLLLLISQSLFQFYR